MKRHQLLCTGIKPCDAPGGTHKPQSFHRRLSVVDLVFTHGKDSGWEARGVLETSSRASGEFNLSPRPLAGLVCGMFGSGVLLPSASGWTILVV